MGIFIKRPLCLFCFCFIGASLLACCLCNVLKLSLLCVFLLCAVVFFLLYRQGGKRKYGFLESAIAITFVCVALVQSVLFVDLPREKSRALVSEGSAIDFVVISEEYSSKYSTKYFGKLLAVNDTEADVNAYLTFEHEADFVAGDRLLLIGDVLVSDREDKRIDLPQDAEIEITSTIDKDLIISKQYNGASFSVLGAQLGRYVRGIFLDRLDKDSAALSLGILTGDSSMISTEVVRDFRRAGLSHLLAVSGLHLSVILGAIELVLTKLFVSKGKRCVIITLCSFGLLTLAGFSASACRSVLMLLCAYLCYALSREPDTLTSLSVAGALILFISPRAVGSISFWLSFLATFGIVIYAEALAGKRLVRFSKKGKSQKLFVKLLEKLLGALIVTLSANVFICIASWIVFGETSVISPLSNLLVTPLGELYLILTLLMFIFGGIPFVCEVLSQVMAFISAIMTETVSALSRLPFSVVSLRYFFAGVIVCIATITIIVLFIVKLKRRVWVFASPLAAVLIFCVCLAVHSAVSDSVNVAYVSRDGRDAIVLVEGNTAVITDVSDGTYSSFYEAYECAKENAVTEIGSVVLTHYHAKHISSLDKFFRTAMVRNVCLPVPKDSYDLQIMKDIVICAKENAVNVSVYERETVFDVCDEFYIYALEESARDGSQKKIISFSIGTKHGTLTYADASWHLAENAEMLSYLVSRSRAVVLGAHGPIPPFVDEAFALDYPSIVASADVDMFALSPGMPQKGTALVLGVSKKDVKICRLRFVSE